MKRMKHAGWFNIGPILVLGLSHLWTAETLARDPLVAFLVRHAEKVDAGRDPQLSVAGKQRAEELANILRDARLEHVHSSDFIRTRDTAAPIAARLDLQVELYDPRDLPSLVEKLEEAGGRHLIVGHSTSTPRAVEFLGGKPGTNLNEEGEFDRLYIVTVDENGQVSTILMRYGKPFTVPECE